MRFDAEQECFLLRGATPETRDDERRCIGLRGVLERRCMPDYDYEQSLRVMPQLANNRRKTGLKRPYQGRNRGKMVATQLQLLVNMGAAAGARAAAEMHGSLAPHTTRLLRALQRKQLVPVLSEFADFYEEFRLASAIDLVCLSAKTGKVCLVEVKVGGENYFMRANGKLREPACLRWLNNSPLNAAYLQLLFYRKMMHDHYGAELDLGECYVAQVCMKEVTCYRLPPEFIGAQQALFESVREEALAGRRA